MNVIVTGVNWPQTHRLVMSHYPPIDLYDDVADPRDWEALALAQAKTNPRIYEQIGDLSLVPQGRRVSGDGASWVMAAFTHISPHRTSRFSDGSYGVYYAGNSLETALREHTYHMARFYAASVVEPGWMSQVRQLVGTINADLVDLRGGGHQDILSPDLETYPAARAFAKSMRDDGANGIVYPSQRHIDGECIAAFYPDVVTPPRQGDHFRYHWNGRNVDFVQKMTGQRTVYGLGHE
ncbi:RES family NAD+ phosphorylase [Rhizobium sp. 32-5/1]|uniref:RES family NAD+ phosphorylase n=1 Tax=Rhizobium sp. 32-5/1 TaxID=3019602 RepID=UPI0032B74D9B